MKLRSDLQIVVTVLKLDCVEQRAAGGLNTKCFAKFAVDVIRHSLSNMTD